MLLLADNHGNNHCQDGTYTCTCPSYGGGGCNASIGARACNRMGGRSCYSREPNWSCWRGKTAMKTVDGMWFSTLANGLCNSTASWCTWRVLEVAKRVSQSCLNNNLVRRSLPHFAHLPPHLTTPLPVCAVQCRGIVQPERVCAVRRAQHELDLLDRGVLRLAARVGGLERRANRRGAAGDARRGVAGQLQGRRPGDGGVQAHRTAACAREPNMIA